MSPHLQVKYMLKSAYKNVFYLIKSHDNGPVFSVSCHYGKLDMESYKEKDVNFVPKTVNHPNCPKLRVIEKCWAIIKQKIKKLCRNIKDLKTSWKKASNSYDCNAVYKFMETTKVYGNHQSLWKPPKQKLETLLDVHRNKLTFLKYFIVIY